MIFDLSDVIYEKAPQIDKQVFEKQAKYYCQVKR